MILGCQENQNPLQSSRLWGLRQGMSLGGLYLLTFQTRKRLQWKVQETEQTLGVVQGLFQVTDYV